MIICANGVNQWQEKRVMEVLTCLEIPGPHKGTTGSDGKNRDPLSTPHLALDWLNALVPKAQTFRSSIAQLFRRKTIASWIFSLSPGGNALWEIDVDTWRPLAMTSVKPRLKVFWSTSLPLTPAQGRGRYLTEPSNQLRTPSSQCWQQRGKGNYRRAGLETVLWPHLNFRCPRECFQPPGMEAVSGYRCNMCLSCFCLHLNASTRWKPEGVEHCKQFWL